MRKLEMPLVDDIKSTTEIADNVKLRKTSYPHLKRVLPSILSCYQSYVAQSGNALSITPIRINSKLKEGLIKNYKGPPKTLSYIERIRKSSPRVCPMCGSLKTGTLDHLLPKEDYPEFAVFSKNLVPACDCNSKRGTKSKNTATGARVLHPYFDDCLSDRQLSCEIVPRPNFSKADIRISYVNPQAVFINSLKYNVDNIVLPSGILNWLSSQWDSLVDCPEMVVHTLPHRRLLNSAEVILYLDDALKRYDRNHGTPNNWESIFVHGLIQSGGVVAWLLNRHNNEYI